MIEEKLIYDDAPDYLDIKISQEINRNQKTIVIRND